CAGKADRNSIGQDQIVFLINEKPGSEIHWITVTRSIARWWTSGRCRVRHGIVASQPLQSHAGIWNDLFAVAGYCALSIDIPALLRVVVIEIHGSAGRKMRDIRI